MNRQFLPPRITSYPATIRDAAKILELKVPAWTLLEMLNEIKKTHAVSSFSFETNVIRTLQHLIETKEIEFHKGKRDIAHFCFGFHKLERERIKQEELLAREDIHIQSRAERPVGEKGKNPELLATFPQEVLFYLFDFFSIWEIRCQLVLVCKAWQQVGMDPLFLRSVTVDEDLTKSSVELWKEKLLLEKYSRITKFTIRQISPALPLDLLRDLYTNSISDKLVWWQGLVSLSIHNIQQLPNTERILHLLKDILWSLKQLKSLSLHNCNIYAQFSDFVEAMPQTIIHLDIRATFFSISAQKKGIIMSFPHLKTLKMPRFKEGIPTIRLKAPKLTELDISYMTDNLKPFLVKNQHVLHSDCTLILPNSTLSLMPFFVTLRDIGGLSVILPTKREITTILNSSPNISKLILRDPVLPQTVSIHSGIFPRCVAMKTLSISRCNLTGAFEEFPQRFPTLETLHLISCEFVSNRIHHLTQMMLKRLTIILPLQMETEIIVGGITKLPLHALTIGQPNEGQFNELDSLWAPPLTETLRELSLKITLQAEVLGRMIEKFPKLHTLTCPTCDISHVRESRPGLQIIFQ